MTAPEPSAMQDVGRARSLLAATPEPRPVDARPPTSTGRAHALAQVLGLVAIVAAVAVLAGWPWALLLGGVLLAGGSLVIEILASRPARPVPALGGDR